MTDDEIEQEIQAKDLTAPRITLATIEAEIVDKCFWQPQNTTVTVCLSKLKNGYTVVGHSACVSTTNFNTELGEKIAYQVDPALSARWPSLGWPWHGISSPIPARPSA